MNDIYITLTGNVAAEPRQYSFDEGTKVTSLKVLTSHRYFDKKTGQWVDGEKVCFTVRCWRALGENVAASVRAGHPVVVSGKLRIREFGAEGDRRFMPEIEASAVGHDLRWGTGVFSKPERSGGGSMSKEMRDRLDEETRDWAMGTRPHRRPSLNREQDLPHASDTDRDVVRHLGLNEGPVRMLGSEDDGTMPAATGSEESTVRVLGVDDATVQALGSKGGTVRMLGADDDTVRVLGVDDDGKCRDTGSEEPDAEGELPATMKDRAAA
ncbi:single-stranded DNA-binding protein [Nonomuraea sp. NPDC049709]|uniref:single-stranded DNA-binding protein n=1 Tax=Nonomuraea sp. NPDC049709 TaxID=3154736 RepID=UPI0034195103